MAWNRSNLNFKGSPKIGHMESAFRTEIRNIPGLLDLLKKLNRLPRDDPKMTNLTLSDNVTSWLNKLSKASSWTSSTNLLLSPLLLPQFPKRKRSS